MLLVTAQLKCNASVSAQLTSATTRRVRPPPACPTGVNPNPISARIGPGTRPATGCTNPTAANGELAGTSRLAPACPHRPSIRDVQRTTSPESSTLTVRPVIGARTRSPGRPYRSRHRVSLVPVTHASPGIAPFRAKLAICFGSPIRRPPVTEFGEIE